MKDNDKRFLRHALKWAVITAIAVSLPVAYLGRIAEISLLKLLPWSLLVGVITSLIFMGKLYQQGYFGVNVPVLMAWVMLNTLTRRRYIVREGFHFKRLWDSPEIEINLEAEVEVTSGEVPTGVATLEEYPTADGVMLRATWLVTFLAGNRPDENSPPTDPSLYQYIEKDVDKIRLVIASTIRKTVSSIFATGEAENIMANKADINLKLDALFKDTVAELEREYGIDIVTSEVSNVRFDEKTEKARTIKYEAELISKTIKHLMSDEGGGIKDAKVARDTALILASKSTHNINDYNLAGNVQGLENVRDIILGGGLTGGGKNRPKAK